MSVAHWRCGEGAALPCGSERNGFQAGASLKDDGDDEAARCSGAVAKGWISGRRDMSSIGTIGARNSDNFEMIGGLDDDMDGGGEGELHDDEGAGELMMDGALALKPEPQLTREQRRSRRNREVRARTISVKRLSKAELERGRLLFPEDTAADRPTERAECVNGMRPCPYVSCQHHLYLDVSPRTGAIKLNFPDLEVWEMTETCALDVADRGGATLQEVGAIMNLTRERIRQVEVRGLAKLQAHDQMSSLRDYVDEGPIGKRKLPIISTRELDRELEDDKARLQGEPADDDDDF